MRFFAISLLTCTAAIGMASAVPAQQAPAPNPHAAHQQQAANQPPFVIPFTRGGTGVNNDMEDILNRIVGYAQANRTMGVVITGIANPTGSESSRANRARAMAQSVRNELRDLGIPESRTRTAAEGDASPTAINRVEVTFVPR